LINFTNTQCITNTKRAEGAIAKGDLLPVAATAWDRRRSPAETDN